MTAQAPGVGSFIDGTSPSEDSPARREAVRGKIVEAIPAGYSPTLHLLAPAALGVVVFVVCLWLVRDLRAVELWTIPLTLFSGFGFEWRVHKSILHKRLPIPGFEMLYVRHELYHHVIYTYEDMTMRDKREWRLVLMPAYAIVLVFGMLIPIGLVLWKLLGANVALLHVATSMIFFLAYEWMHLAYHLPADHPVSRVGLIGKLRELHRRHHEPRLMKRWNFNVTVPVFDWIHRTAWSESRERAWREKRAHRTTR